MQVLSINKALPLQAHPTSDPAGAFHEAHLDVSGAAEDIHACACRTEAKAADATTSTSKESSICAQWVHQQFQCNVSQHLHC
jgi:hypothetical protein